MISVRLDKDEEKVLKKLSEHFRADKSTVIKKLLFELYEYVLDMEEIKKFENKERGRKVSFVTAEDILKE